MVSICGNLGEIRVQKLADQLQNACIDGDGAAVGRLLPDLRSASLDAAAFVRSRTWRRRRPGGAPRHDRHGGVAARQDHPDRR